MKRDAAEAEAVLMGLRRAAAERFLLQMDTTTKYLKK